MTDALPFVTNAIPFKFGNMNRFHCVSGDTSDERRPIELRPSLSMYELYAFPTGISRVSVCSFGVKKCTRQAVCDIRRFI
jgi:hypothetical protein